MTLPLPATVSDSQVQECLDVIAQQFPIRGANLVPRSAEGAATAEWTAEGKESAVKMIKHGLGGMPARVFVTAEKGHCFGWCSERTATEIEIKLMDALESRPKGTTATFFWRAVI